MRSSESTSSKVRRELPVVFHSTRPSVCLEENSVLWPHSLGRGGTKNDQIHQTELSSQNTQHSCLPGTSDPSMVLECFKIQSQPRAGDHSTLGQSWKVNTSSKVQGDQSYLCYRVNLVISHQNGSEGSQGTCLQTLRENATYEAHRATTCTAPNCVTWS